MGDPARFRAFADFIVDHWPDRELRIADVAAGKGGMHAALYQHGYRNVTCFDQRLRMAKRPYYRYELFTADHAEDFDLVIGMHPDGATDEAIEYAHRRHVPFAVVPCCTRPSAWRYDGPNDYASWIMHLAANSSDADLFRLPIAGAKLGLVGGGKTDAHE